MNKVLICDWCRESLGAAEVARAEDDLCESMSDLFHDLVPDSYIVAVARLWCGQMAYVPGPDQAVGRLRDLLNTKLRFAAEQPHIWWGVSVEDKKYGLRESKTCATRERAFDSCPWNRCWKTWGK